MFSPSDFNNAVPQFTNGNYASNPLNPLYVEEPGAIDYNRGVEPLQTLPAQWWNWLGNQFTAKLNKLNIYVKNIFDELTQLLSLVGMTPDGTEGLITIGQLKTAFTQAYPNYLSKFMHTLAEQWTYIGTTVVGDVTTTQTSKIAIFEHVNTSDASTTPATETDEYKTKYVDTLPVKLGGTGADNANDGMKNLVEPLTTIAVGTGVVTDAVVFEHDNSGTKEVKKMPLNEVARIVSSTRSNVPIIVADSLIINNAVLSANDIINILFTADIFGPDAVTPMSINYNGESISVLATQGSSNVPVNPHEVNIGGTYYYEYCQMNTVLELLYNGSEFVVINNPIVMSGMGYEIYANGSLGIDSTRPVGSIYEQYPGQANPNDLFKFSTWEVLNYGGAFFRSDGGNADIFDKTINISSMSGTNITFASNHGLDVGSIIYDKVNNESRIVTTVNNATSVKIDSAFTDSTITEAMVGQASQNRFHTHNAKHAHSASASSSASTSVTVKLFKENNGSTSARCISNSSHGNGGWGTEFTDPSASTTVTTSVTVNEKDFDVAYNGNTMVREARSENFTYKIWVRTA